MVSTHSRPKAAGSGGHLYGKVVDSFNTQPPEGGWPAFPTSVLPTWSFQHTAARRRLESTSPSSMVPCIVSTHSRPKAAGRVGSKDATKALVSTHSRPKAAGSNAFSIDCCISVSTHSRPKAAGPKDGCVGYSDTVCFNTQPPEGGWTDTVLPCIYRKRVSTHSRPKAAGS